MEDVVRIRDGENGEAGVKKKVPVPGGIEKCDDAERGDTMKPLVPLVGLALAAVWISGCGLALFSSPAFCGNIRHVACLGEALIISLWHRDEANSFLRDTWPAFAVLLTTLVIASFITGLAFVSGPKALWKAIARFVRLLNVMNMPILLRPYVCSITKKVLHTKNRELIQTDEERVSHMDRLQDWFLRPLQGIGLSMCIATMFFMASLFLSFLWTLDDMGIRQSNIQSGEVKMIGRYVGVLFPIVFGLYGIITPFEGSQRSVAIPYIAQMTFVLYSPFLVLAAMHFRYMRSREAYLLKRLNAVHRRNVAALKA